MANLIWDSVNNVWKGTFTIANDGTGNSNETFTIDLGDMTGPVTVTLNGIDTTIYPGATNTITVNDCSTWNLTASPTAVTEGNTVTLSLATSGVSDGSYGFNITGLQSGDLDTTTGVVSWDGTKYIGSFNLVNNVSSPNLTLNIIDDNIADDGEVMTITLENGNDTKNVTINDPVVADCCAGMANEIATTGGATTPVNYLSTNLFESGGKLCYHTITSTGSPTTYTVQLGTTSVFGQITTTGNFSDNYVVYVDPNGQCYGANLDPNIVTVLNPI
tara:strand:- start:131 stop:952 length:822 start_codon:yes stop_codon:yes gene_type:complete